jgi:UPF0271 protein
MNPASQYMDLNCDMGEIPEDVFGGAQESLMSSLTSVNIACSGHAGDAQTMEMTIRQAMRWNLAIGAHPGWPDKPNFGRVNLNLSANEIAATVFDQLQTLAQVAARRGTRIAHVKPHGALYNQAAADPAIAAAIAAGVARFSRDLILVGLAGSAMLDAFRHAGFAAAAEAFADRRYEPDGSLRSRNFPDALIHDPEEAASQAVSIAEHGKVIAVNGSEITVTAQTLCIHGDTPGAPEIAASVAQALLDAGVGLRALAPPRSANSESV